MAYTDKATAEWKDFKTIVSKYMKPADGEKGNRKGAFHGLRYTAFWQKASRRWWSSGMYDSVFSLVAISFMYRWDNSCCERGFSVMSRIKSKLRSSLGSMPLCDLMRIVIDGPPLAEWDPRPAIAKWRAISRRTKAPGLQSK